MKFYISAHKLHTYTLLCILFFCVAFVAVAQEASTTPSDTTSTTTQERADAEVREDTQIGRYSAYTTQVQDRLINLIQNVQTRLTAAINRMDNIIGRLDSRIAKLKAEGVNTIPAEETLTRAKENVIAAKATLASLSSPTQAIRGDSPRESFQMIKTQLGTVRDLLKETHRYLRETVGLLKTAIREKTPLVSPTETGGTTTAPIAS